MDYRSEAGQTQTQIHQYNIAPKGSRDAGNGLVREPGPCDKAREVLGYLRELEQLQADLRQRLYGPYPATDEANSKTAHEPSLEENLGQISQRAACLVGEMKSILTRL